LPDFSILKPVKLGYTKIVSLNNLKQAAMLLYRSIFIAAIAILLSSQKIADVGHSYTYDDGDVEMLNGHVKQIVSYPQSILGSGLLDTVTTNFDKKGYQTEAITATPLDRRTKESVIYTYDKAGKISQAKHNGSEVTGIYSYNKDGYTIRVLFTPENPLGEENRYTYDKAGYLTEFDFYENPKVLDDITKYKYDANHRLIETDQRSAKGQMKLKTTFDYKLVAVDSKNNWIKTKIVTKEVYPSFSSVKTHQITRKIFYY
jgi:YD repeat-containing protein